MAMEASYFEVRQSGNLMSVLSADVAQLDIVSDSVRHYSPHCNVQTAFVILIWMSYKLALTLFLPLFSRSDGLLVLDCVNDVTGAREKVRGE